MVKTKYNTLADIGITHDKIDYFKNKIIDSCEFEPNTGCILFTGAATQRGYGTITINKKSLLVTRVIHILFKGNINSLYVMHKCDTPACVNPDHLIRGSAHDNMMDCSNKKRNHRKFCSNGHEFSDENIYYKKRTNGVYTKSCRICNAKRKKSYLDRIKLDPLRKDKKTTPKTTLCKHGHVKEFFGNKFLCRKCRSLSRKKYRINNRDKVNEQRKRWRKSVRNAY